MSGTAGRIPADRPVIGGATRQAHVWLVPVPEHGRLPWELLSPAERDRAGRFRRARDSRSYVAAHALVRAALSLCAPSVPVSAWTFRAGGRGRPEIAGTEASVGLRFNLSHADGLVACVVTAGADCGVDVERCDRTGDVVALGRQCLTPAEQAELEQVPPGGRAEWFARRWTLKEAYAKARGMGLGLPFDSFGFVTDGDGSIALTGERESDRWLFVQRRVTGTHVAAVAVRQRRRPESRVRWQWGIPNWDPDDAGVSVLGRGGHP